MKPGYVVTLAMLGGIGIGAVGVRSLQAQTKPPVYMVGLVDVSNMDGYAKEYLPTARASINRPWLCHFGRGAAIRWIEGSPPGTRFVILKWVGQCDQLKLARFTGIHGGA